MLIYITLFLAPLSARLAAFPRLLRKARSHWYQMFTFARYFERVIVAEAAGVDERLTRLAELFKQAQDLARDGKIFESVNTYKEAYALADLSHRKQIIARRAAGLLWINGYGEDAVTWYELSGDRMPGSAIQ